MRVRHKRIESESDLPNFLLGRFDAGKLGIDDVALLWREVETVPVQPRAGLVIGLDRRTTQAIYRRKPERV